MTDEDKVFKPVEIEDAPFPSETTETVAGVSSTSSGGVVTAKTIKERTFPTKIIAHETISAALNTKSKKILGTFEFTEQGAIQVGKYANGVSGDVKLSPNGIVARDSSGNNTFTLDGTTGDATFKGTVQAETVIAGAVQVGDDSVVIDGANRRILVYDASGIPVGLFGYLENGF